jgi:serine/threonine protein kinase
MGAALGAWLAGRAPSPVGALVEALLDELFGDDLVEDRRQLENLLLGPPQDLAVSAEPGPAPPAGPAERFDPRIGTKIGDHYRIERLCGTGGMSRVYQASHDRTARLFAIKILRDDYRYKADVVGRFVREVQNVARLEHRNIIKIVDCGRTPDDLPFFAMEYVDGFTIRQLLDRDGRLPIERSIEIGMEVASGLKSAHQAAIVHRDLKPSNVMIVAGGVEAGSVRILDFGLSKNLEIDGVVRAPITALDVVVGSPHYMAPEQAGGGPAVLSSDVYAIGELLYEMISGVPTWDGENPGEVIHRKLKQDPTPLSRVVAEVSEDLNRVVMSALRRDPAARPSMIELAAQLAACLDPAAGLPGGSELAGPVQQPPGLWPAHEAARRAGVGTMTFVSRRSAATHPVLVAVGGLLLFATGVGSVIWSRSTGPARPGREAVPVGSRSLPVEPARAEEPLPELPVSPGPPPELSLPHGDADQDHAYRAITRHEPRRATRSRTHRPSRSRRELAEKPIRAPEQEQSAALPSSESPRLVMDATEAFGRRDYGLALSKAQEALAAAGNRSFDAHMILARTYFILDRFRAAEEHFRAAVLLRPADGRALRGLASAAARTRN